jgi:hypothetical protein
MLRRVNLWLLHGSLLVLLQGCGGCGEDDRPQVMMPPDRDGNVDEEPDEPIDGGDSPIDVPDEDDLFPGDPPEELEGERCAADTNKIYELATYSGNAQPAQLAVFASRFGLAYVSNEDVMCTTGVSLAEMSGAPGQNEPSPMTAYDDCTLVEQAAIARGDDAWLLAIVDNRQEARDLWVHAFDPESGRTRGQHRITENMAGEGAVELVRIDADSALIVWAETAFDNSGTALHAQFLSGEGEPMGEPVEIAEAAEGFNTSMAMVLLGEFYVGLAYVRDDGAGGQVAVLDVLDRETAERERDPWVLTTEAGANGTIDIASDSMGAGVAYTLVQGTSRQVWFQELGLDGRAAPVLGGGGLMGGPSDPLRVVENPQLAIDLSLARMPRGFALAYRALPSVGVTVPQIRAHFLDKSGRIVGDSAIALAEINGGQTALEMSTDGRMVLSWTDTDEEGLSTLRALIVPCGT